MSSSFIQIASWNIEHLSGASREDKKQSVYALTDHIEMAGVDIVVLQEIYVTDPDEEVRLFPNQPVIESRAKGNRRNGDLDAVCFLLEEHLGKPWRIGPQLLEVLRQAKTRVTIESGDEDAFRKDPCHTAHGHPGARSHRGPGAGSRRP